MVFFAGAQLAINTTRGHISGDVRARPAPFALWVTAASIVGKLLLAWNQFHAGRANDSAMLVAIWAPSKKKSASDCAKALSTPRRIIPFDQDGLAPEGTQADGNQTDTRI